MDLGEKMFALIEIVNTSSVINSTNCVKRIELYDTRLEADTIAKERNDLVSKVIDKVIEDAIKKENETCLESYSTFKVLEISPKKEFDVSTRVTFDMDENWEDFNKSFDSIVNNIVKGNNE